MMARFLGEGLVVSPVALHRRGRRIAFALVFLSIAAPAASEVPLDPLLAGIDDGCTRTPLFQAWQDDLVARHLPENGIEPGRADMAPFAEAIGAETVVDKGDWKEVAVPLRGVWRGVAVKQLVFSFGKENGIYGYVLEFDAAPDAVRAAFASRVKRSAAKMKAAGDGDFAATTGLDFKGRTTLWCDFSN